MNSEDEEFNRVEREAKQRKQAVLQALHVENERMGLYLSERQQAFREIAAKIQAMPFNDATIDSFLVWLREQK